MTLTNDQLGRIARTLVADYGESSFTVLCQVAEGRIANAIKDVIGEYGARQGPLLSVLREVSEEVEREARKCHVRFYDANGGHEAADWDGDDVLMRTDNHHNWFASWAVRITITNEAHGCAWTWETER